MIKLLQIIAAIIGLITFIRTIMHYVVQIFEYLLWKKTWDTQLEYPRIAMLILFLSPGLPIYLAMKNMSESVYSSFNLFIQLVLTLIVLGLSYFLIFIVLNNKRFALGSKKMSEKIIALGEKKKKREKSAFSGINNNENNHWKIEKLYNYLVDGDLIDDDHTSKEDFIKVLCNQPSKSNLVLKMDNPSARDFFDCLKNCFPEIKNDTPTSFFKNYEKIYRIYNDKSMKLYSANAINDSRRRTPESKKFDLFKEITNELNEIYIKNV